MPTPHRHIIGVSGHKRAGKDEFCNAIRTIYGADRVARVALADPLKREVAEFLADVHTDNLWSYMVHNLPVPGRTLDSIYKQMQPFYASSWGYSFTEEALVSLFNDDGSKGHFRLLLQVWGTEYRRQQFGDDYWLKAWDAAVEALPDTAEFVVTPDVRFPNEFEHLYEKGAEMVRVNRLEILPSTDLHVSETALDNETRWDRVLYNAGSLTDYKGEIMSLYRVERAA